jgi:hypothetical protein
MQKKLTRRDIVRRGLGLPLAGGALLALSGCGDRGNKGNALVCIDIDALPSAEASVRRSLGYTESSDVPGQTCSGCDFFTASGDGCGSCTIFDGGAVNPAGRCASWSADA